MPTSWDGRPAVLTFLNDVTDREGARREAADAENRLQRISEIAPFFLFIYDYDLGRDSKLLLRPLTTTVCATTRRRSAAAPAASCSVGCGR